MKITDGFTVFDVETTGVDVATDEIVQLGFALFERGKPVVRRRGLCSPSKPIPAEASAIHGITDAMVANAPTFAERVAGLRPMFDADCLIVGYNARRFDVPMLNAHLERAGADWRVGTPLDVFDVVRWVHREASGKLLAVAASYGLTPQGGAGHDAAIDAHLTGALLLAMIEHGRVPDDVAEAVAQLGRWGRRIDAEFDRWSYWLYRDRHDGQTLRFGCGREIGKPLAAVDPAYLQWMLDKGHVQAPAAADEMRNAIAAARKPAIPTTGGA
jgi:DNA polymerase-3 subunit epsilon